MTALRCLLLACAAFSAPWALAQEGQGGQQRGMGRLGFRNLSHPLIDKVVKAAPTVKFAGVREVTLRRPNGDVMQLEERILRHGLRSRVEFPPGSAFAGQIIVEDGKNRRHFLPAQNEVKVRPMRPDPMGFGFHMGMGMGMSAMGSRQGRPGGPGGPGGMGGQERQWQRREGGGPGGRMQGQRMEYQEADGGRVAGLATRRLTLSAGDRTLMRMWISPEHGIILKREVFDLQGKELASFKFEQIRINPSIPASAFVLNPPGSKVVDLNDELKQAFKKTSLPAFRLGGGMGWDLKSVRPVSNESMRMVAQSYARQQGGQVTLFVVAGTLDPQRISRLTGGRAKAHKWQARGATLVLVGAMDEADLKKIAALVRPLS